MNVIASGTARPLQVPDGHRGCVREHRPQRVISKLIDEHDAFEPIERVPRVNVEEILAGCEVPALGADKKLDACRGELDVCGHTTDRRARVRAGEGGRYGLEGANR
jgi:hypothetical protein